MANEWYVERDGKRAGPLSLDQLKRFAASGKLRPTDKVCQGGAPGWTVAGSETGLFPENPLPNSGPPSEETAAVHPPAEAQSLPRKYWLLKGTAAHGPYIAEQVRAWLADGTTSPETLACQEGGLQWLPLSQMAEFAHAVSQPPSRRVGQDIAPSVPPTRPSGAPQRAESTPALIGSPDPTSPASTGWKHRIRTWLWSSNSIALVLFGLLFALVAYERDQQQRRMAKDILKNVLDPNRTNHPPKKEHGGVNNEPIAGAVRAHSERGATHLEKGELEQALAAFTAAIRLHGNDAGLYYERARAYAQKGDYDRAIADFSEAIRLAPNYAKAYQGRSKAYAAKGDAAAAGADLKRAMSLDPGLGK